MIFVSHKIFVIYGLKKPSEPHHSSVSLLDCCHVHYDCSTDPNVPLRHPSHYSGQDKHRETVGDRPQCIG